MTDTANLEDGFYWVRFNGDDNDGWEIAECVGGCWEICRSTRVYSRGDFDEIDPRPIKREDVE